MLVAQWEQVSTNWRASRLRDELLNVVEFQNMQEARWFAKHRLREHNEERPHSSLDYQTPAEFAASLTSAQAQQTGLSGTQ